MPKSRVFLILLISFIIGVLLRSFIPLAEGSILSFFVFGILVVVFGWTQRDAFGGKRSNAIAIAGFSIIIAACGVYRYHVVDMRAGGTTLWRLNDRGVVTLSGIVIDEPDVREKNTRYILEIENEKLLVFGNRYPAYVYGDTLKVTGELASPESFNNFDYPSYLAKDGIYSLMYYPETEFISSGGGSVLKAFLFRVKMALEANIADIFPEPHAAFLDGLILGSRSNIPPDIFETFQITGITHIIALSGFNITIIGDNFVNLLRAATLGPVWSFWIASAFIILFTLMVGASSSIVRAAIMGMLVILARKEGRAYASTNALVFAGALMIFHNPRILRFDVAFQLSFMATLGLIYIAPRIEQYFVTMPSFFGMRSNLISTLSAQCMVLPLILYYFGAVSFISPLANVLILAAIPASMFFGFLATIAAFVSTTAGMLPGSVAYALLGYKMFVAKTLARVPLASVWVGEVSWLVVLAMYFFILYLFFLRKKR